MARRRVGAGRACFEASAACQKRRYVPVTKLQHKGVDVTVLTRAQIRGGSGGAKLDRLTTGGVRHRGRPDRRGDLPPGHGGQPVSIVGDPAFVPTLGPRPGTFEMTDLLFFAFAGKKAELASAG